MDGKAITDARTPAPEIGACSMVKYDLHRVGTFHRWLAATSNGEGDSRNVSSGGSAM